MNGSALDRQHMARALELARRGLLTTDPNPRVGCVIAEGARVLAEGWHERAGHPHAEAMALASLGGAALGATAYVTLEPCCHVGRTPPCTEALIAAGLRRVVYAAGDPNPRVNGGGARRLAQAGIGVTGGLLESQARELNPGFHSRFERGRPWLRLGLAQGLEGATGPSGGGGRGTGSPESRADVQRLRARSSAVMTGIGTVLADDPRLDLRLPGAGRQPLRVVLDAKLRTPPSARIVAPPGSVLLLTCSRNAQRRAALAAAGAEIAEVPAAPGGLDLEAALRRLALAEVNELQAECGPTLGGALLAAGLVDELVLYVAGVMPGAGVPPLARLGPVASMAGRLEFRVADACRMGGDLRLTLSPRA